jgi:hypothetical protein
MNLPHPHSLLEQGTPWHGFEQPYRPTGRLLDRNWPRRHTLDALDA